MKEEDIIRYEINGQVYLLSKDLFEQEQKFIESQQKAMADYIFGGVSKDAGQQGDAVEYIAQQHNMSLAREYDWIERAINTVTMNGFHPLHGTTTVGKMEAYKMGFNESSMQRLKHDMWNSKVNHLLAIERSKFHDRYEDEKEAIDAQFTEEQEAITAKMVALKLTDGDDYITIVCPEDQPFKNGGILLPNGKSKQWVIRKQ